MMPAKSSRDTPAPSKLERLRQDYAFAFFAYRREPSESRLNGAYELGRKAMAGGMTLLDLAEVHHEVVGQVLLDARGEGALHEVAAAASTFFMEVLSTFQMAQRGFNEVRAPRHGSGAP